MQDTQPKAQERTLESIFRDILAVNDRQRDKWSDDHALKNILDHRPTIGEIRALVEQSGETKTTK
ncbi:hypothetical protein ABCW43_00020 [Neorhizobium sp. IRAMC:178]|uniref:hypothetical protein n=1 Tax=Neorhizobium tunisiense TaxID=3144793 RepID=UPI0031F6482D